MVLVGRDALQLMASTGHPETILKNEIYRLDLDPWPAL